MHEFLGAVLRVLLVYPNSDSEIIGYGDLGAIAEPLALAYLAAAAEEVGCEVRLVDLRFDPEVFETTFRAFSPDLVAVTGYSMHVHRVREICAATKSLDKACQTAVGGHHATLMPIDFHDEHIDFIVEGEGCAPFQAIIEKIRSTSASIASDAGSLLEGVWSRGPAGTFEFGGKQPEIDLDKLPCPDRVITSQQRSRYFIDWMKPIALVRTTVGCPYRCSFCSLWKIMDGKYYRRDLEATAAEIETVKEPFIFLVDDEPFINPGRMTALAELLIAKDVQKEFFAYCRVDTLLRNREMLELWVKAGLRRVFLGIEGVTAKEMKSYEKRLSVRQVEQALVAAREMGLKVFASFIVNPSYEARDFETLKRFIDRNEVDYPSFTIWTPLPGTEDFQKSYDTITKWEKSGPHAGRPDWRYWDLQHLVVKSVLSEDKFMEEYQNLRSVFSGSYSLYQQKSRLVTGIV